jgi:hypothetical protein
LGGTLQLICVIGVICGYNPESYVSSNSCDSFHHR